MSDYFKDITGTKKAIEEMFKPYTSIQQTIDSMKVTGLKAKPLFDMSEVINLQLEPIRKINEDFANQVSKIVNPFKDFKFISDELIIPSFFESYNSTKELIENFEEYEEDIDEKRLQEIKDNVVEMEDVKQTIDNLDEKEQGIFKSTLKDSYITINENVNKDVKHTEIDFMLQQHFITEALSDLIPGLQAYFLILHIMIAILNKQ